MVELRDTDAGLFQPDDSRIRYQQLADIFITKNQETLDNMLLARLNNDDELLGMSLGYPATAVAAYNSQNKTFISKLDAKVQLSEAGQLTYFTLSKDNWQKEIDVVQEWVDAVKESSSVIWFKLRSFARIIEDDDVELILE